jgi:hypothetical protein
MGDAAALAAGLVLAFDPLSLAYHTMVLTETPFALLLSGAVALLATTSPWNVRRAAAAGVVLGVAALCRPIGLYLPIALTPLFLIRWRDGRHSSRALAVGAMLVAYALTVGVWITRNALVFGAPVLTSLGGENLYFHRAAYVEAEQRGVPVEQVRAEWERSFAAKSAGWSDREKLEWLQREGAAVIADDPGAYIVAYGRAVGRTLSPETRDTSLTWDLGPTGRQRHVIWSWIHIAMTAALVIGGVAIGLRRPDLRVGVVAVLLTCLYFAIISGPEVYARFRMPLMPLFAAAGAIVFAKGADA